MKIIGTMPGATLDLEKKLQKTILFTARDKMNSHPTFTAVLENKGSLMLSLF